jgi:hypothetical protein
VKNVARVARQRLARSRGARRHLPRGVELDDFFDALRERGVCYVVLRWFDTLPSVDPGEDIDLLVADEDLPFVHSLMTPRPGLRPGQKFDIYSVSGLPGSDFAGVPYYAPRFAREVLDGAVWLRGRYRVPSPEHHFATLSYHAVYHKGYASGLADGVRDVARQTSDHDYEAVLAGLAAQLGTPVTPTLDSLDLHLAGRDLRPPLDTLERLEPRNPWIHDRFFAERPEVDDVWRGLAVFVLRERAAGQVDAAVHELDRQGFEVLEVVELDPRQREAASHRLRGGNWERGPWPVSGGGPSTYLVAYDVAPRLGDPDDGRGANQRIPAAKESVRARLLQGVDRGSLYNPVHSSDNPAQALDYLQVLADPDLEAHLRALAGHLVEACTFPYPVLRVLPAQARRAQVAVVDHPELGLSVCKVFRPGAARFFEREVLGRTDLGDLPEMPELLEKGDRWFLTPLYDDDERHVRRHLPGSRDVQLTPEAARSLARFAVALHERGLFLLDLSTQNLVSDPSAGLKVLDLEFLQEYAEPVADPLDSYTFRGVPDTATGYDLPQRTRLVQGSGNSAFHPAVTGSSVEDLLRAPRPGDGLRRAGVQLWWYAKLLGRQRYVAARTVAGSSSWGRDLKALGRFAARRLGRR